MPIHDWARVDAGIFHAFHHDWITEIARALNRGLLCMFRWNEPRSFFSQNGIHKPATSGMYFTGSAMRKHE